MPEAMMFNQELWLKPVQPQPELKQLKQLTPTSLGGAEAVRLAGMDAVSADVFETGEIFRQAVCFQKLFL